MNLQGYETPSEAQTPSATFGCVWIYKGAKHTLNISSIIYGLRGIWIYRNTKQSILLALNTPSFVSVWIYRGSKPIPNPSADALFLEIYKFARIQNRHYFANERKKPLKVHGFTRIRNRILWRICCNIFINL